MMTTLLSLFGGGLGGLLRFVPEIFKLFTDKNDRDHEFRMTQLQLEIDKGRAAAQIDVTHAQTEGQLQLDKAHADEQIAVTNAQSEGQQAASEMQAYVEAIKAQGQMTGVPKIDALNQAVRPVLTLWWMVLFTVYKLATIVAAAISFVTLKDFIAALWTVQDWGVLSMITSFWFVDRVFRKQQGL